jgi:hypothetical protein
MEYDQSVVGGEPEIAFDPGAKIDRRTECWQRVFRNGGTEMQSAVSESARTRIEWIRT